jgi:hypothetical protein
MATNTATRKTQKPQKNRKAAKVASLRPPKCNCRVANVAGAQTRPGGRITRNPLGPVTLGKVANMPLMNSQA